MGGKKKKASTAELQARLTAQTQKEPFADDDGWEGDAALIEQERTSEPAKPSSEPAKPAVMPAEPPIPTIDPTPSTAELELLAKRREVEARVIACKLQQQRERAALLGDGAKAAGTSARMKGKAKGKKNTRGTEGGVVLPAAPDPVAQQAAPPERSTSAERQRRADYKAAHQQPEAPLIVTVVRSPSNVWAPEEMMEAWTALDEGGFEQEMICVHPGVSCDRSGQAPIIGSRHKLREEHCDPVEHPLGYDLCAAEFTKLGLDEQGKYDTIPAPYTELLAFLVGTTGACALED